MEHDVNEDDDQRVDGDGGYTSYPPVINLEDDSDDGVGDHVSDLEQDMEQEVNEDDDEMVDDVQGEQEDDVLDEMINEEDDVQEVLVVKFTKIAENRLRLPSIVYNFVDFDDNPNIAFQNMEGLVTDTHVRMELSGNYKRYTLTGWNHFMKENQISIGESCTFRYRSTRSFWFLWMLARYEFRHYLLIKTMNSMDV